MHVLPIARRAYAEVMGDQTGTGLAPRLVVRVKALHNGMGLVHLHVRSGNARNAHKLLERSMDAAMEALREWEQAAMRAEVIAHEGLAAWREVRRRIARERRESMELLGDDFHDHSRIDIVGQVQAVELRMGHHKNGPDRRRRCWPGATRVPTRCCGRDHGRADKQIQREVAIRARNVRRRGQDICRHRDRLEKMLLSR